MSNHNIQDNSDCKKIKVLHVVKTMDHGGIETYLMSVLRNYDRERFQMDIMYTGPREGSYAPDARTLGARLHGLPLHYDQIRFVWKFYRFLRRNHYDAVNVHLADISGGATLAAWFAGVRSRVVSYHSQLDDMGFLRNLYLRGMRTIVLKTSTSITTSSPAVTESHFSRINTSNKHIEPIAYGCDIKRFSTAPEALLDIDRSNWKADTVVIGHIGSYRPQKNHEALIQIARNVLNKAPHTRFVLCGAASSGYDDYKNRIDQMIDSSGLRPFLSQVQGLDDVRKLHYACDIFILPSRNEGMPVSLIEAQAAGRPVVASRINGIVLATAPEMQQNLFEIDDVESFANCLVDLIRNKEKRIQQGIAGQKFARENLDIKVSVNKYQLLYEQKSQGV